MKEPREVFFKVLLTITFRKKISYPSPVHPSLHRTQSTFHEKKQKTKKTQLTICSALGFFLFYFVEMLQSSELT